MADDRDMQELLRRWPVAISERKWRLYACACCRRDWKLIWEKCSRRAVRVAERFADGFCSESERADAYEQADEVLPPARFGNWTGAEGARDCVRPELRQLMSWDTYRPGMWRMFPEDVVNEIFGRSQSVLAFDTRWRTTAAIGIAEAIYTNRAFDRMPILADALEDAGCEDNEMLDHCRRDGWHVRGCWVLDLILGKE
jgi:hypothetical protein